MRLPRYQKCRILHNFYSDSDVTLFYQFGCHRYCLAHFITNHNNRKSSPAEATGGHLLGLSQVPLCRNQSYHIEFFQQHSALFYPKWMIGLDFLDLLTQFSYLARQFVVSATIVRALRSCSRSVRRLLHACTHIV